MKILQQIWNDVRRGENIDMYIAVPLAIGIAILNFFGLASPVWITSITLVILSLLSTALLGNRHTIKQLSEELADTSATFFSKALPDSFESDFETAKELWLSGVSLSTIIRTHYSIIERKLRSGCRFKILIVNPNSLAVEMAEMRAYARPNTERARQEIMNSLQDLCDICDRNKDHLRNIEIRTISNPLGHGTIAIDPETTAGTLYIQNYPFKTEGGSMPKFILRAKDGYWYDFFKKEFNNLWVNSEDWRCNFTDV